MSGLSFGRIVSMCVAAAVLSVCGCTEREPPAPDTSKIVKRLASDKSLDGVTSLIPKQRAGQFRLCLAKRLHSKSDHSDLRDYLRGQRQFAAIGGGGGSASLAQGCARKIISTA